MRILVFVSLLVLATLANSSGSRASVVRGIGCEIHFESTDNIPISVRNIMTKRGDKVAFACFDKPEELGGYSVYTDARKGRNGVCQFAIMTVDLKTLKTAGVFRAPMLQTPGECPRQDDQRYIQTHGVSPGLFVELQAFWKSLDSQRGFDAGFALLPAGDRDAPLYKDLRAEFSTGQVSHVLQDIVFLGDLQQEDSVGYELYASNGRMALILHGDFTEDGFRVFRLDMGIVN